ncbi:MAG: hypothetical protein AAF846_14305 [Chloroflexota bacterium]
MANKTKISLKPKTFIKQLPYLAWHTLLVIVAAMAYGYIQVFGDVSNTEFTTIIFGFVTIAVILYIILQSIIGIYKAGIVLFILSLAFFLYGHIYIVYLDQYSELLQYVPETYLTLFFALIALVVISKYRFIEFNKNLNIMMLILSVIWGIQVAPMFVNPGSQVFADEHNPLALPIDNLNPPANTNLPDIYYLLFDAYPSNSFLNAHFEIDNSGFTDGLEDRGFYVAYDANSNYTATKPSLSSTLNLNFIQDLIPTGSEVDYHILDGYMHNSRAARMLRNIGYDYIQFGNGYTRPVPSVADHTIDVNGNGEVVTSYIGLLKGRISFWEYLNRTTIIRLIDPTLSRFESNAGIAWWGGNDRFYLTINELQNIPQMDAPTFTYYHIVKPHLPVTLDQFGNQFYWDRFYSNETEYLNNQEIHFENQLTYINQTILDTVDKILQDSETPPIIIIQADHGSVLRRFLNMDDANQVTPILNAFYFPDENYDTVHRAISPVNTFRVVFNNYFGMSYPLLDDSRRYYLSDNTLSLTLDRIPDGLIQPPYGE